MYFKPGMTTMLLLMSKLAGYFPTIFYKEKLFNPPPPRLFYAPHALPLEMPQIWPPLQLCSDVRLEDDQPNRKNMEKLYITHTKLLWVLENVRVKDRRGRIVLESKKKFG